MAEAVPKRVAIQTKLPAKLYPKHEEFASRKPVAADDDKIFQAMAATGLNPQKSGLKRRIIKKLQLCKARKWQTRYVLHPGVGQDMTLN